MNMINQAWLAGPEPRHPLHDPATAKELIGRLATGDSLAVLTKISGWIREIVGIPDFPLQHQIEVLDLLDQFAKDHQINLVPSYFDAPRMHKLSESQLWRTSFQFWETIGSAYLHCLERFQAGNEVTKEFRRHLPMIICRALRSLTLQLKWTLLRYGRVEERIWRDLGRAYLFAGSWNFSTRRSAIYPGSHGESTAQEEILKALMFFVSAPDTLTPVQQHIAERIVAYFGPRFAMHTSPGPGCFYTFDLSMHVPPIRARKGTVSAPLLRFFGPGTAAEGLHFMIEHMQVQGTLPPGTPLGGYFNVKDIKTVLDHLARCWSEFPAARRGKRRDVLTRLTVVPGLVESAHWMEQMIAAGTVEIEDPPAAESWVVVDASDGGYGVVVASHPGDWLTVDALVGIRRETANSCQMGILRRIAADVHDQQHVGMQLIGEIAIPVSLFVAGDKTASAPHHAGQSAILISRRPDKHQTIELLLPHGTFIHNKTLLLRYSGQLLKIEHLMSIEQTKDYHWASFRLVAA
jgi:hypothetical protein